MRYLLQVLQVIFWLGFSLVLTGCSTLTAPVSPLAVSEHLPDCYILFDAGSSGTRLYIYEKLGTQWLEHEGPKVGALADPVREFRGKKHSDIDAVTSEVVGSLAEIKKAAPLNKEGKPKWQIFDWSTQCHVVSATVYATAGMRLAEQKNPQKSLELLTLLKQKLQTKVGTAAKVTVRTLTGYEEGLYAWLTVREQRKNNDFGIVEMGGASSQITFPCADCDSSDDALRLVIVDGKPLSIYSYSFLGLGQDESPKTLGVPTSCAYGIGTLKTGWREQDCADNIPLEHTQGIRDPYNFNQGGQGTYRRVPTDKADVSHWFLTGTFWYMDQQRINTCCVNKGQCPDDVNTACFRPVYFNKYLQTLKIPATAEKSEASWTLGAAVCTATDCLQKAQPLLCRWLKKGCLQQDF